MTSSIKKTFLTYLLCILLIPIVLSFCYGAVSGMYFGQQIGKNRAKINLLLKERGLALKETMSSEETEQTQQIISKATNIDFDKVKMLRFIFELFMAGIQGFYAGFLLRSSKHLYIITGCIFFLSLAGHVFTHMASPLINLFLITCAVVLSGYVGINWKVRQDD